jgi:hypothetical protein
MMRILGNNDRVTDGEDHEKVMDALSLSREIDFRVPRLN